MNNTADGQYVGDEYITEPLPQIAAGKTGKPEVISTGGVKATGYIEFADKPTANDTITLAGKIVKFTAGASAPTAAGSVADPIIVNIKADLTLTIDEAVSVLNNAGAPAVIQAATYSNTAGTKLSISYDTYGLVGNAYTLAASSDTPSASTLTGGQDQVDVSLKTETTQLALTQSVDQNIGLPDGDEGQNKTIYMTVKSGAGNAVVTPDNLAGGSTLTFDTVKDRAVMKFLCGEWTVIDGTATLA